MDFNEARYISRMNKKNVAEFLGLSLQTINKYSRTGKAPTAVIQCLLMIGGNCPTFKKRNSFSGWSFSDGFLWSPAGERFTSGDVLSLRINQQLVDSLYKSNTRNRKKKEVKPDASNIIRFSDFAEKRKIKA